LRKLQTRFAEDPDVDIFLVLAVAEGKAIKIRQFIIIEKMRETILIILVLIGASIDVKVFVDALFVSDTHKF